MSERHRLALPLEAWHRDYDVITVPPDYLQKMEERRMKAKQKRFRPIEDRVVVKVEPPETMVGSIHLPDISIEKPQFGTVLAVGPGRMEHGVMMPMTLKVGDRVCFALYAGNEVKALGDDVVIMRQCDVLGVEEES
jgi:chaperonin GroES